MFLSGFFLWSSTTVVMERFAIAVRDLFTPIVFFFSFFDPILINQPFLANLGLSAFTETPPINFLTFF